MPWESTSRPPRPGSRTRPLPTRRRRPSSRAPAGSWPSSRRSGPSSPAWSNRSAELGWGMATPVRILAFSASARLESLNRKFLNFAVQAAKDLGCEVTVADLNEYVLPLYHGDLEDMSGLPENAVKLIALITSHQGLLIASPEYNSMITPLLKNTIDWCTRADDNPFVDKVAAVISASPGAYGGV